MNLLPADYRIIEMRLIREFEYIEKVVERRYHILRCADASVKIVDAMCRATNEIFVCPVLKPSKVVRLPGECTLQ